MGSISEKCIYALLVNILHAKDVFRYRLEWIRQQSMSRTCSDTDWNRTGHRACLGHIPIQTGIEPATDSVSTGYIPVVA